MDMSNQKSEYASKELKLKTTITERDMHLKLSEKALATLEKQLQNEKENSKKLSANNYALTKKLALRNYIRHTHESF